MAPDVAPLRSAPPRDERLRWAAPGLALADLGLSSAELLFAPGMELSARVETLEDSAPRVRVRFPLPGTSDARGNLTGRPGPLGTGWLWLTAYRGGFGALLRARCTAPRRASLAEREWNRQCYLRAQGVGAPERWLRTDGIGAERARGLEALGRALGRLARSGVELPALRAEHLWLTPSGSGECETHVEEGLRKNKLPGVTLVEVEGGRLRKRVEPRAAFASLFAELGALLAREESAAIEHLAGG